MTKLLTHDEIDAFIIEYDGGCVHNWKPVYVGEISDPSIKSGEIYNYKCTKCPETREADDELSTIDNPIAHSLGKLVDKVHNEHYDYTLSSSSWATRTPYISACIYKDGEFIESVSAIIADYEMAKLASAAALGNVLVEVLK